MSLANLSSFFRRKRPAVEAVATTTPFAGLRLADLVVRRAIGFQIKVDAMNGKRPNLEEVQARVVVKRHGMERVVSLSREELACWMNYDDFRPWPGSQSELAERLERQDLLYFSATLVSRQSAGRPLGAEVDANRPISLRSNLRVTLALADGEQIVPLLFMPRRGSLDDKRLIGLRCASIESNQEVYQVDLFVGQDHTGDRHWLLDCLPLLSGQQSSDEIVRAFSSKYRPQVAALITWLDACALLESPAVPLTEMMPDNSVMWLGHASTLIRAGQATILCDPLFFCDSVPRRPRDETPYDLRRLPKLDAILITHGDNDHLHGASLARLPKATPIVVPDCPQAKPYQVDLEGVLRFLGFSDIRVLRTGETAQFADVLVTAAPFIGEDWGLTLAKATYVVSGPQTTVYLSADSARMPEVWRDLGQRHRIDFAFLGVSGCAEPMVCPPGFGYGEFYAIWVSRAKRNQWIELCNTPSDAADAALALNSGQVFGYAASGLSFMDMAHSDRGSHAELAALLVQRGEAGRVADLRLGQPYRLLAGATKDRR